MVVLEFFCSHIRALCHPQYSGRECAIAASSYSAHLIVRVVVELITGRYLLNKHESTKFWATIIGILFLSVSYLGFAFTSTIAQLFLFYGVAGLGLGIASPAKIPFSRPIWTKKKRQSNGQLWMRSYLSEWRFPQRLEDLWRSRTGSKSCFSLFPLLIFLG